MRDPCFLVQMNNCNCFKRSVLLGEKAATSDGSGDTAAATCNGEVAKETDQKTSNETAEETKKAQ